LLFNVYYLIFLALFLYLKTDKPKMWLSSNRTEYAYIWLHFPQKKEQQRLAPKLCYTLREYFHFYLKKT
ncbi:hypothetical protein, partial [Providencia rettgeri]|uniref:hypothetical protein n=1 Tax=Providencia rettgeri TaxID=587 RepID=UPI001AAEFC1B